MENKIRTLAFAFGATVIWLMLAYAVAFDELSIAQIVGLALIGLFLSILAMGQG